MVLEQQPAACALLADQQLSSCIMKSVCLHLLAASSMRTVGSSAADRLHTRHLEARRAWNAGLCRARAQQQQHHHHHLHALFLFPARALSTAAAVCESRRQIELPVEANPCGSSCCSCTTQSRMTQQPQATPLPPCACACVVCYRVIWGSISVRRMFSTPQTHSRWMCLLWTAGTAT